jgi:hypothetical protein
MLLRWPETIVDCPSKRWLCIADWLLGCRVQAICDAHDRNITAD